MKSNTQGVVFLPDRGDEPNIIGVNIRYYPIQASVVGHKPIDFGGEMIDQAENTLPTTAVLVGGDIGDYACYVGHGKAEWVARHGDKICFAEAQVQFPGLEKENYRG
jgi:hypothetical protein